jgi:hypothetical protein
MDEQEFSISVYESKAVYDVTFDHGIIDFVTHTSREAARRHADEAISEGHYVRIERASPDTGDWVEVEYSELCQDSQPERQRVILFVWRGWWMPDGPDNGRTCVFSSEEAALEWARSEWAPDSFTRAHFRCLPVPNWGEPGETEIETAPIDCTPLTFRFELYSTPSGACDDTFQVRGREEARRYVTTLTAFEEPGQLRICVPDGEEWREISREDLMGDTDLAPLPKSW